MLSLRYRMRWPIFSKILRVTLELEATAQQVLMEAGDAKGVIYRKGDRDIEVRGQAVALGANAIFNPWLLQRSGFQAPFVGPMPY